MSFDWYLVRLYSQIRIAISEIKNENICACDSTCGSDIGSIMVLERFYIDSHTDYTYVHPESIFHLISEDYQFLYI